MSPASKTYRREHALLAALKAAGGTAPVKQLIPAAVALGPDRAQLPVTIAKMLCHGTLVLVPGQPHGRPLQHLIVTLPSGA